MRDICDASSVNYKPHCNSFCWQRRNSCSYVHALHVDDRSSNEHQPSHLHMYTTSAHTSLSSQPFSPTTNGPTQPGRLLERQGFCPRHESAL
ncbi:hypothetical protein K443DRAFT_153529 [Laccaria amethystina LaAM-08-1]|uniref:Uncharacterized protein n=1 Tax=Laccaria amethystina LaAM-08-1 TaxID=1095629 RepID=A0A0C9X6S7_9AGAR|nr:hypothetical protein K443DRAFT_153529 [Laccaria amethystina LaAM-08-1]